MKIGLLKVSLRAHILVCNCSANKSAALMDSIKADHGYNLDSKSVRNLLQTMSGFSATERRDFLQFITGSPKLPIGGQFLVSLRSIRY
jgi:hypothetical protein